MEYKSIGLELKDIDKSKRTAVIAHAAYNNVDRVKDISRKGMFTKSWAENKSDISFYLNHKSDQVPGKPLEFWEDDNKAYTKAYLGTHTLGEDVLKMLDEGIITKASFGYIVEKKNYMEHNGDRIRELKEVRHIETSVLTVLQANPLAGVVAVNKSLNESDILELKACIEKMEKFCRNTSATDESIKSLLGEIEDAKHIISRYDVTTQPITEPGASSKGDNVSALEQITLMELKIKR